MPAQSRLHAALTLCPFRGTAPIFYQWRFNGTPILNATNRTLSLTNISLAQGGLYQPTANNSVGYAESEPAVLTVNPANPFGSSGAFSIVHYNVKGNFASDWTTNAPQVQAIARQLLYLNPDIIALNEIPNGLRSEMTNWMKAFFPAYNLAISPGTDGAFRSGVISRFVEQKSNFLSVRFGGWQSGRTATDTRIAGHCLPLAVIVLG